ncbi:MAG TPA: rRNA maturation RNase YbeY [bacterium]|jgi:probable rRNA maturation factor|nr:rRNA maturation RNase YbeY [bacterium]HOA18276.1 rRNA maturation RNase YbeY [bacterium]
MSKKIKSHNFNNIDGKRVYIAITLTNDKEIHELNKKYLKRNYPTDVLSFNMDKNMEDGTYYLGDVIINCEQAGRQFSKEENGLEKEISELASHGILHLLGVHHEENGQ